MGHSFLSVRGIHPVGKFGRTAAPYVANTGSKPSIFEILELHSNSCILSSVF